MTVEMLYQRRAALDPVAIIAICHAVDVPDFGMVDMAADNAVYLAVASDIGKRIFEIRDELHRVFHL